MDPHHYDLSGRKVLVTGGAGFIGSHTIDRLIEAGCGDVVVVDDFSRGCPENLAEARSRKSIQLVEGDIRDRALMADLIRDVDTVFHLAALRITQCAAEPEHAMKVMADATFNLLNLCVAERVRKVVMASSASVYGMAETFPTNERHHPYGNRTLYGALKMFGEGLLRSFNDMYGLNYVAMRYFNVYGPRMDIHGRYTEVLVRWMERVEAGLQPMIFGTGSQSMDMVHVTDVAKANVQAAVAPACDVVLNVGSGSETTLLQLAHLIAEVMGRRDLGVVHEKERSVNPVPRRLSDFSAAHELIGYSPSVPLPDGLRQLVDWWRTCKRQPAGQAA